MQGRNSRRSVTAVLLLSGMLTLATMVAAAAKEYFIEDEIDYLRQAQGISLRVPALIRLANIRLVTLGMKEKSKEDKELEKKIAEIHNEYEAQNNKPAFSEKTPGQKSPQPPQSPIPGVPIGKPEQPAEKAAGPYLNLTDFTRVEMLRGYIEALDEIKRNIDDAYRNKREVREPLEQFEKFCNSAIPALRRFQAHTDAELQAISDARTETQESLEAAQDALKIVPKTEKSGKP